MSTTNTTELEVPNYNFEAIRSVISGVKTGLDEANKKGCYTLDEASALKRYMDIISQLVDTTEKYQLNHQMKETTTVDKVLEENVSNTE